ncbi:hypothetical protein [Sulfuricella sp. T08]|uniref:hypothetical protein n=1 Tax=Sulfuricella sp. T08 TaxID=1632857 RepID=UPI0011862793|nr:hypothetical protein [Sulfuricella sp. T08]
MTDKTPPDGNGPKYPGGETWVDQYDERLHPSPRFARLRASLTWCREKILGPIIIGLVLLGVGALVKCQQESPPHSQQQK